MRQWKMLKVALVLVLSLSISGCFSSLGHYQENLKVRQLEDGNNLVPQYKEVKSWAYDVQDGLDTRATVNQYALEYGAIIGLAAVGAMAGLAIFSPSSDALKGIPIGAAFLSGAAAYYDNHYRYDMYSRASALVRVLIDVSDERVMLLKNNDPSLAIEARCLKQEVGKVIGMVRRHIVLSDPNNLAAEFRAINSTVVQGKITVDQGKLTDLVKAVQGDLSDLDVKGNLRETYCQETGLLLLSVLDNPVPLITTTQVALLNFSRDRDALVATMADGVATVGRLTTQADTLAGSKGASAVKAARDKIADLDNVIQDATRIINRALTMGTTTAAGYITTLMESNQTRETVIDTSLKLIDERERIRGLDQEATKMATTINAAIQDAEAAIRAVQ